MNQYNPLTSRRESFVVNSVRSLTLTMGRSSCSVLTQLNRVALRLLHERVYLPDFERVARPS
jgi:hypothetical protein